MGWSGGEGALGEEDAEVAGGVFGGADVAVGLFLEEACDGGALVGVDLEEEPAFGGEEGDGEGDEAGDEGETFGAAAEGEVRLVEADVGVEAIHLFVGDVGEVGGDHVEQGACGQAVDEVAFEEGEAGVDPIGLRIFAGDGEGCGGEVDGDDLGLRDLFREGDGDAA